LQRADSVVYGPLKEALSFPYLARRNGVFVLLDPSLADRVGRMSQFVTGDARGEYLRAYYYRMKNQAQRASEIHGSAQSRRERGLAGKAAPLHSQPWLQRDPTRNLPAILQPGSEPVRVA